MTRYDLTDHARRLDMILRDLGYAGEDGEGWPDWRRACKVINRRVWRPLPENRLHNLLLGKGAPMTADEAVQVADGLGFDVRRLLYEEPPRRPERPQNLLDELDWVGMPD